MKGEGLRMLRDSVIDIEALINEHGMWKNSWMTGINTWMDRG